MKVLFIATSVEKGLWLAELTHPYWHLIERGVEVDFASPKGGKISWYSISDPYAENSQEADDIVSKGFLSIRDLWQKRKPRCLWQVLISRAMTQYMSQVEGGPR